MKRLLLLFLFGSLRLSAQEVADTTRFFPLLRQSSTSLGFDLGADVSRDPSVRVGFAMVRESSSGCAFGWDHSGTAIGLVLTPSMASYGAYVYRWRSHFSFLVTGIKGSYEVTPTHAWLALQPQIGIGNGQFRITYNYTVPFFLGSRTPVSRHSFGLAYTFYLDTR